MTGGRLALVRTILSGGRLLGWMLVVGRVVEGGLVGLLVDVGWEVWSHG